MSHVRESGGILILSISYLYSGLWEEGERFISLGRKSGPFLPTVSVQLTGPDTEALHYLVLKKTAFIALESLAVILPDWLSD